MYPNVGLCCSHDLLRETYDFSTVVPIGDPMRLPPHLRRPNRSLCSSILRPIVETLSWRWCSLWAANIRGCSRGTPGSREINHPLRLSQRIIIAAFVDRKLWPLFLGRSVCTLSEVGEWSYANDTMRCLPSCTTRCSGYTLPLGHDSTSQGPSQALLDPAFGRPKMQCW